MRGSEGLSGWFRNHRFDAPTGLWITQPEAPAGIRRAESAVGDHASCYAFGALDLPTRTGSAERDRPGNAGCCSQELASCGLHDPVYRPTTSEYAAPFCGAAPGSLCLLYLRFGGTLAVDLRPSGASSLFEYTWIDLEQSRERTRGKVNGGAVREFHAPEDYPGSLQFKDWLLYIRRAEP